MPVIRRKAVVDRDGFFEVTHGGRRMRIGIRPVDPVVHVAGVPVEWEVIVVEVGGERRKFHGYGADPAMAFVNAREAAIAGGADFGELWDSVTASMLIDSSRG